MGFGKGLTAAGIMSLGIAVYFLSAIVPGAFDNFFGANTTGWDAGTVALWSLIPLAIIALLVMRFAPSGKGE
jgi:hypothetical protein